MSACFGAPEFGKVPYTSPWTSGLDSGDAEFQLKKMMSVKRLKAVAPYSFCLVSIVHSSGLLAQVWDTLLQINMEEDRGLGKTSILYIGPSISFRVNFGEGKGHELETTCRRLCSFLLRPVLLYQGL